MGLTFCEAAAQHRVWDWTESINQWEKINFCFVHYRWDALCFLNDVSDKPTQARAGWEQSEKYAWNIENTNLPPPHHPGSRGEINPKWLNFPQTSHLAFVQTVSQRCETKRHLHVWNKGQDTNVYKYILFPPYFLGTDR